MNKGLKVTDFGILVLGDFQMAFLDLTFPFQPLMRVLIIPSHVALCHFAEAGKRVPCAARLVSRGECLLSQELS